MKPHEGNDRWSRLVRWTGIALIGFALAVAVRGPSVASVQPGTPAPAMRLATLDGEKVELAPHRGRPMLVNFFATWCPPCRAEIPVLNKLYAGLRDEVTVVGVLVFSGLPGPGVAAEVAGMRPVYPVWVTDDDGAAAWRVTAVPVTVLLDERGVVRWVSNGMLSEAEVREAVAALGATASR